MINIALVNPGTRTEFADNEPLNLAFLAAFLEARGIGVRIIDKLAGDDVGLTISRERPTWVGVTATTPLAPDAYRILRLARSLGCRTVMGGVHASVLPEEASRHADHVIVGEGETALVELLTGQRQDPIIKGSFIRHLDDIPAPARHLLNMEFYAARRGRMPTAHLFFLPSGARLASLLTSRGCPYSCLFCHNSWKGLPVRYHQPGRVIEEIRDLRQRYGIDALYFMDDDFFVNRPRFEAICKQLIAEFPARGGTPSLCWAANARVTSVDPERLALARRAGCRQVCFGFESGSQKILDVLQKQTTVGQASTAIRLTREAGLLVYGTFMIGNPTETREDMEKTRRFILRNRIDSVGIGITTPYPGTRLWQWCVEKGLVRDSIDWGEFTMEGCPIPANEQYSPTDIETIRSGIVMRALLRRKFLFVAYYLKALFSHPRDLLEKFGKVLLPFLTSRR